MVSKEKFNALPRDLKAIVEAACTAEANYTVSEFTAGNNIAQTTLVEEHGVTIGNFPDDVVKTAFANAIEVVRETAEEGDVAKRIFDSWWSFRTDAVKRAPYAEQGYMNNRALG